MFRATEALDIIDQVIADSKIEPTDRVATARDNIAELVDRRANVLDGLTKANAAIDADIDTLALHVVTGQLTPTEVVSRLSEAGRRDERAFTSLKNKTGHAFDREAEFELRKLGDALVYDVLAPWAERIVTDLTEVAGVVVEHGHRSAPQSDRHQPAYDRATELVTELHKVWVTTAALRGRGILTSDDALDARLYAFQAPHKLADLSTEHREVWWTCYAVVNGAKPCIRSVDEIRGAQLAA
ncbi:hypothetical protein R1CP_23625 [Rhodococcus opacus]|uniref:Uncharacterized protein n=1 Tax=Rhodococcus opacus TaxID=37919 RepID=A0A1B1K9S4_RHOOP|nr:hypothetical protein [Rhodococcus opacus]ANS29393.1 hypothetical protein R1CP_23625 [Rhodococcus opacus]